MRKLTWAIFIFLLAITVVSVACAVSPPIATMVGNGLVGVTTWVVTQAQNVSTMVMAWQYAWVLFWFGMPVLGFIIGSLLVYRFHLLSRVKQTVLPASTTTGLGTLQKEPAEPERQQATPTAPTKEEEPQPIPT